MAISAPSCLYEACPAGTLPSKILPQALAGKGQVQLEWERRLEAP